MRVPRHVQLHDLSKVKEQKYYYYKQFGYFYKKPNNLIGARN